MLIYQELKKNIPKGWEKEFEESDEGIYDACNEIEEENLEYLPPHTDTFRAFHETPKESVKVVIIGQDPYFSDDKATGLAFSCNNGVPPSLENIYKELKESIDGFVIPDHGDLTHWAKQGVLLLNVSLTAKKGKAGHKPKRWMDIIDSVVSGLTNQDKKIIWIMWGAEAQKISKLIEGRGIELKAAHPSPANTRGGFLGCGHFKTANDILIKNGKTPIDWQIPLKSLL
jgi:uracil-DNA glycosylase